MENQLQTQEAAVPTGSHIANGLKAHVEQMQLAHQLATGFCTTDMVPKAYQGNPNAAAVAIQWGLEIGLAPLQALQNIAVIAGTPALWGDALVALVKGSGQCEYLTTDDNYSADNQVATVRTKRKGEPEEVRSFSMHEAEKAGLTRNAVYQKHPKRMLQARARSHLLRDVYADLLKGFNIREVAEEDSEMIERDVTPHTASETLNELLTPPEANPVSMADAIGDAKDINELKEAGARIKDIPEGPTKESIKDLYMDRLGELRGDA